MNHLASYSLLQLMYCSFCSIQPWSIGLSLLDVQSSLLAFVSKFAKELFLRTIHYHNIWYSFSLMKERQGFMHLRLTSHWISSCEPISHCKHLSTSILASGLHLHEHHVREYINCKSSVSQLPVIGSKSLRECRIEYRPNTSLRCSLQGLFGGI